MIVVADIDTPFAAVSDGLGRAGWDVGGYGVHTC